MLVVGDITAGEREVEVVVHQIEALGLSAHPIAGVVGRNMHPSAAVRR